ncbi:metallophosphoesterase [Hoeflea sp.]|uniref:metallophosphoesterase n=1 Tax=Hoeflea sp. TaxID=1940281 RepID=UPI003A95D8D1
MKLWIFSDLHIEVASLEKPFKIPDADVCVVAGDILDGGILPSIQWLAAHVGVHMPVVFTAGNHEFYGSFMTESLDATSLIGNAGGVHFLENASVTIGDAIICGATLWTDFELFGRHWRDLAMRRVKVAMNDYSQINFRKQPYAGLRPIHTYRNHVKSRQFLEHTIDRHQEKKIVVVTHHAPSMKSVEEKYRDDIVTTAFASDLEALIVAAEPALWVHGHVHHQVDYVLAKTRVVANPRGYPGEISFGAFDPALLVEV